MTDFNLITTIAAVSGPARPKGTAAACRSDEPEFGQPDPELMQAGSDRAKLLRLKVEERFTSPDDLAFLVKYVSALAEAPNDSVLLDEVVPKAELLRKHPELARIGQLDAEYRKSCRHYRLFEFFRSDEYWNNAIILLSVLAQKNIELDNKEGIGRTIDFCQRFRARIEAQGCADKKFGPVEYHRAVLDLTEAELRAQVKNQPFKYYAEAQGMARRSLTVFSNLKNKFYWPSEPDYFTISKGLLILGDLNIKLKDVHRREIAALRRQGLNGRNAAAIAQLEKENDRLLGDAYRAYGAMAGVRAGFVLKLSDIEFNFSRQNVEAALQGNIAKGFINAREAGEAYKAIFRYQQAVAVLKKNSLLPQLRRTVKEDEIIAALKETDDAVGELRGLLKELKAETAAEADPKRQALLQNRVDKMQTGFYLHFGGLVRADLSLGLLDRMNFAVIKRERPDWETFLNTVKTAQPLLADSPEIGRKIDKLVSAMDAALAARDLPDGKLEQLRNGFTELVTKEVARGRYEKIRKALLASPDGNYRLKYLYGWDSVKLIEIAVRAAEYVRYSGSRKDVGQANHYIQECEQLKVRWIAEPAGGYTIIKDRSHPRWAEADRYFDEEEYLGIELNYLESIFYAYRYDQKTAGTANSPGMIDNLSQQVKDNANYLPEEQLDYFTLYAGLKNAIAQIQRQKFEAATGLLNRIRAQVEGTEKKPSSIAAYLEPLAWDEHTLKAELYHQLAVAYSWIEKDKPASAANQTGIYAVRAYKECNLSTSIYDKVLRPSAIASDLKIGPDGRKIKTVAGGAGDEVEVIR